MALTVKNVDLRVNGSRLNDFFLINGIVSIYSVENKYKRKIKSLDNIVKNPYFSIDKIKMLKNLTGIKGYIILFHKIFNHFNNFHKKIFL